MKPVPKKILLCTGLLSSFSARGDLRHAGRPGHLTVKGMFMHSSMAFTLDGLPLGLTAIKFWTRDKFKGADELKRHVNPTRIPIEEKESFCWLENLRQSTRLISEPGRCVHIGDRESDIFAAYAGRKWRQAVSWNKSGIFPPATAAGYFFSDRSSSMVSPMACPMRVNQTGLPR